ncbi:PREDICTED: symplekin-like, partial [Rhagoletis zephyria]|uniref:symplekin-like n=1 Tax=Rhagoletis zephyria TaxID=28612 RepID=UPI0008113219
MSCKEEDGGTTELSGSPQERVIQLLNSAQEATGEPEKVSLLAQAQEFIIHRDLLEPFLDHMLAFQSDRMAEVRKLVAGFIEATCRKAPAYFPRVTGSLRLLLADEVANVLKKAIQVSTGLYKVFLAWLTQSRSEDGGDRPSADVAAATLMLWTQMKSYISTLLDSTENDGIRTQCVKFLENVILCQTKRDAFTTTAVAGDFSLDQITNNKLIEAETFEAEAAKFFSQLVAFQAKLHISSVNLMATMQSLALIARQRPAHFFLKVVAAFETLSTNLPPTLAKIQVNSVNKQMKLLLLMLFKHPFLYAAKQHHKLQQLLLKVGATSSEVTRSLNEVRKRGIKVEAAAAAATSAEEPAKKRSKVVGAGETDDSGSSGTNGAPSSSASTAFNVDAALQDLARKFSRHDVARATETTAKDLVGRLTPGGNADALADLVLSSLHLFPETLSEGQRSTLLAETAKKTPQSQAVPEIAKRLAAQLTAAGLGPGVEEMTVKYTKYFVLSNKLQVNTETAKKIHSLVKRFVSRDAKRLEAAAAASTGGKGGAKGKAATAAGSAKLVASKSSASAAGKGSAKSGGNQQQKQAQLLRQQQQAAAAEEAARQQQEALAKYKTIESAVSRMISEPGAAEQSTWRLSPSEQEAQHQLLGKLLSDFSPFEGLKTMIKEYVFRDIRSRSDILLNMLFTVYVAGKEEAGGGGGGSLDHYAACLHWVLECVVNHHHSGCAADVKERDHYLAKFFVEAPCLTEDAAALLKSFILGSPAQYPECAASGVALAKLLVRVKPRHRGQLLRVLLQVAADPEAREEAQAAALEAVKGLYLEGKTLAVGGAIEEFALRELGRLQERLQRRPKEEEEEKGEGQEVEKKKKKSDEVKEVKQPPPPPPEPVSEAIVRSSLSLYFLLLPFNQKLIHHLPPLFTEASHETKRTILRLLNGAVEHMMMEEEGDLMDSPELARLLETCTAATELLPLNILHKLTEGRPPSLALFTRVRDLYQRGVLRNIRFLIPVLSRFSKKEIIGYLPQLIKFSPHVVQEIFFYRLLTRGLHENQQHHHHTSFSSPISPTDLLVALHNIDSTKCELKFVVKATDLCLDERAIYTSDVLAVVMQMLLEQQPLPTLLMRTVIKALRAYPRLENFVLNNILQRCIVKQVWSQKAVWDGFVKCCQQTMPKSFPVLLQLPPAHLRTVFEDCPPIRPAMRAYVQALNEQQLAHIPGSVYELIMAPPPTR